MTQPGQTAAFQLVGQMTIRNVTNEMSWDVSARLDGNLLKGSAAPPLYLTAFGLDPPEFAGLFIVSDPATINIQLVAERVDP